MNIIKVERLTKKFKELIAVNNISFTVKKGEIFGFLGPNGAGKTTTINMLSTLLKPSEGDALIDNSSVLTDKDSVRRNIGIVFQIPALDTQLTGRENLEFHARLYNMNKADRVKRINWVLELVELKDKADILVRNYSGGMKRRLEIARGLIHKPKVLFLDEPTLGLDAQTRRRIWKYIKQLNKKENMTIMLTTHYMEEADYLCNRVAIIDHGRIIVKGTPSNLKKSLGGDIVIIQVNEHTNLLATKLKEQKWVKKLKTDGNKIVITILNAEKATPKIFTLSNKLKIDIKSFNIKEPSLEDVFIHYTGRSIREQKANSFEKMNPMMRRRMMNN